MLVFLKKCLFVYVYSIWNQKQPGSFEFFPLKTSELLGCLKLCQKAPFGVKNRSNSNVILCMKKVDLRAKLLHEFSACIEYLKYKVQSFCEAQLPRYTLVSEPHFIIYK